MKNTEGQLRIINIYTEINLLDAASLSLEATECSRRLSRRSNLPAGTGSRLLSFSLLVSRPLASTKHSCLSVSPSLIHTVHFRDLDGLFIRSALGQVVWNGNIGAQTALVAYSWFSTVDEAVFSKLVFKSQQFSDYPSVFFFANRGMWANKTIFTDLCTSKTTVRVGYLKGIRMRMISEIKPSFLVTFVSLALWSW